MLSVSFTEFHYAEFCYDECRVLIIIMLSAVLLNVIMQSVVVPVNITLSSVKLSVTFFIDVNSPKSLFAKFLWPWGVLTKVPTFCQKARWSQCL
jgi:hypothetical protein